MRPIPVGLTPWRGGADDAGQMSVLPWFLVFDKGSLSKPKARSPSMRAQFRGLDHHHPE